MNKILVPFKETKQFSTLVDDYFSGNDQLKPFYRFTPDVESFKTAIEQRKHHPVNRKVLCERLINQYGKIISPGDRISLKIDSLKNENTFTVTTGHQLNIFTGPLYFIYKIATTIKLSESLKERYPDCDFVPVFWMATEDHDFEEISKVKVFGQEVEWKTNLKGPVGRFSLGGFHHVVNDIKSILGNRFELPALFEDAYLKSNTLAEATRKVVHSLFGEYGLVIIDGDDSGLKSLFKVELKAEIESRLTFSSITQTNNIFSQHYKEQVTPREINLFYVKDGLRERIVPGEDGNFTVFNTDIFFSRKEILIDLEKHPERYSPNVVMRPVYQEKILPNLAYIGGPGELNYWFQLLSTFDTFKIPFPVLILRNCMMVIGSGISKKMAKLELEVNAVFQNTEYLTLEVLESAVALHIGTEKQAAQVQKMMEELSVTYTELDSTLSASIDAEKQKMLKGLQHLEEKARRALKKKNETLVSQVKGIKEILMPKGNLQERTENILSVSNGDVFGFIREILNHTDPFVKQVLNKIPL